MSATTTTEKPAAETVQFTDALGRTWKLDPTVGDRRRLLEQGLDLWKLITEPAVMGDVLFADPEKLVGWVWYLCAEQAEQAGIDPEQFAAGFTGEVLERAARAVVLAAVHLCRGPRALRSCRAKLEAALDAAFNPAAEAVAAAPAN